MDDFFPDKAAVKEEEPEAGTPPPLTVGLKIRGAKSASAQPTAVSSSVDDERRGSRRSEREREEDLADEPRSSRRARGSDRDDRYRSSRRDEDNEGRSSRRSGAGEDRSRGASEEKRRRRGDWGEEEDDRVSSSTHDDSRCAHNSLEWAL